MHKRNRLLEVHYSDINAQRNQLNEVVQYKTARGELAFAHPML